MGVEALARWIHPERGVLGPDVFIELAEDAGLIGDVGQHGRVARRARDLRRWQTSGLVGPDFTVSINLAPQQLISSALLDELELALTSHGVDPACLILEITEGAMMRDTDVAIANLTRLRDLGLRIAIDDFGTGYSSLAYLQRFPIDILKIDKSFVDGIDRGPEEAALALAILRLVQTLSLSAIAEGVERESQCERLRSLGCEHAQGFYFCKPAPRRRAHRAPRRRLTLGSAQGAEACGDVAEVGVGRRDDAEELPGPRDVAGALVEVGQRVGDAEVVLAWALGGHLGGARAAGWRPPAGPGRPATRRRRCGPRPRARRSATPPAAPPRARRPWRGGPSAR